MLANLHPEQTRRLEALRRFKILDTPSEPSYDDIVFLAAQICSSPIAVINFIDEQRQWFKAELGLGVRQTPLDTSICSHAILADEFMMIPDTLLDDRFRNNPLCAFDPNFRFYAGALLKTADGLPLGTVCVLDTEPRILTQVQIESLQRLARQVMSMLELRVALDRALVSEQLARNAIESSTDGIMVLDPEGRLLSINQSGMRLMEVDDFAGLRNKAWNGLWESADKTKATAALQSVREGNEARFSGYFKTAKGNEKFWEVTVAPIVDREGERSRILSIIRDMTIHRIQEAQLRETAKLESLGVLAGGIAHDFNNLLTGVLGNASLIAQTSESVEDRHFAEEIVTAAQRAADLTRQMLAYSGKGRFVVQRLNLSSFLVESLHLIKATIDKKADVILSLDENLPFIEADPGQMQQLIMNLVINASEALEGQSGKVIVSTRTINVDAAFLAQTFRNNEPSLAIGSYVEFTVQDTGCGMKEETLARIFDPFFTTKFTGRGLGLAAVSGILRGHAGAVRVYSHPEEGSTFRIFLPVAKGRPAGPVKTAAAPLASRRGWGTILVVDDEQSVRKVAKAGLQRTGYEILLAENGSEAVELFETHRQAIRLVILDLTMSVMSGEEALARLRDVDPRIPILLSSGYNQVEIIRRFTKTAVNGFIQKPYTFAQLIEAVERVLFEESPKPSR